MPTVRFSINPEDPIESVVISAGAAVAVKAIELTVDQSAIITDPSGATNPRPIKRGEVVIALQNLIAALQRDNTTLVI